MDKLTLTELINRTIQQSYLPETVDEDYQSTFSNEGGRKANYIIDDLKYKESKNGLNLEKLCFLSIGGADGSEIEKVLCDTEIKIGILIEISDAGAQMAREKAEMLSEKYGKVLKVLQGDAFDKLDDCLRIIKHYVLINAIDGLVVSAQAVLHELPRRSKNYDSVIFLGKLYSDPGLRIFLFYSREPCNPQGWTERVRLRIDGVSNTDLFRLASHVRDRLQIKGSPEILASNWLDLESILAIETLHKLLRNDTVKRIEYELGEQLTEFDPISIKRDLESCVEGMKVSIEFITTLGFKRAMLENNVEFIGHHSELLPFPKTHVEIIGFKPAPPSTIFIAHGDPILVPHTEDILITNQSIEKEKIIPDDFANPFDGEISNERIKDYLSQFESEEIPLVLKLIERFIYISPSGLNNYCKVLYQKILDFYSDDKREIIFIPLGKASKSSGIISYFFRTVNNIPDDKFISSDSLIFSKVQNKICIFIDDLLASGHQALFELSKIKENIASEICFAVLVSCEQGEELLQEKSNITVLSAKMIKRIDSPFDVNNRNFTLSERKRLNDIVTRYSPKTSSFNPYGYAGLSLLLSFYYNTPDNTLPIFWSPYYMSNQLLKRDNLGRSES